MTLKYRVISASTAVLILFGAPVMAQDGGQDQRGARMFDRFDSDASGAVSLDEFVKGADRRFSRMDRNNDGTVTEGEVDAFIAKRTRRIKDRILSRLDANGDGAITQAEFEAVRRDRFARLDVDKSGEIEKAEAREAFKRHGKRHGQRHGKRHGGHRDKR